LKPEKLEETLASWRKTIYEGKAGEFIQSCENIVCKLEVKHLL